MAALCSALEVKTREQLPEDRAETQNRLGVALQEQAIRTGGSKRAELLAQAVAAYRSALEVYTHEVFPAYHELVQANLAKAEDLFRPRRRRSSQEVKRLVVEFETSGLRQNEFCRTRGIALSTLRRHLKTTPLAQPEQRRGSRLVV